MKAKELIPHGLYKKGKSIVRITAIDIVADACRGIDISNGEDTGWFPSDKLSPISLTPEILEKNGFEHNGKYYNNTSRPCADNAYWRKGSYANDGYMIGYHTKTDTTNGDMYKLDVLSNNANSVTLHNIFHVHELQHALRLCGQSDLADNFKVK